MDDSRHQPLLLPNLKVLNLGSLNEMSHVWKCNWNKFLTPQQSPFQCSFENLTDISLHSCDKIKYLFSPLMAKLLSNLKSVRISHSDCIEEVVSNKDYDFNATFSSSHTNNTFFPQLDSLKLIYLPCLKRIDGGDTTITTINDQFQGAKVTGASWSFCQYPREMEVHSCNALSSLIPWYAVGQMKRLENLNISYCERIMEVFESQTFNINNNSSSNIADEDEGSATTLTSLKIKDITRYVPQLSSLKVVHIIICELLEHVFTFSALESLKQLTELKVINCKATQVIVKEEQLTTTKSSKVVVFPRLQTLELRYLPNLEGFFLGTNEFRWPLLDDVMIKKCPKMTVFTSGHSETPKLKYIHTSVGKYILEHDQAIFSSLEPNISQGLPVWSFHNLIELDLRKEDVTKIVIPFNALRQMEKLEKIRLISCRFAEEVFEVALEGTNNKSQMSSTVVQIPNLTQVKLGYLYDLKYIWKSNEGVVLQFPNLTTLYIEECNRLEHVFTYSMVASLVQLQHLSIRWCSNMKVVVKEEEIKDDAKVNENIIIMFPHLKSLKLGILPSLKGFYLGKEAFSWTLLDTLEIKDCPTIEVFTKGHLDTPELEVIDTNFGMYDVREGLNSFINTRQEGVFARE